MMIKVAYGLVKSLLKRKIRMSQTMKMEMTSLRNLKMQMTNIWLKKRIKSLKTII